MNNRKENINGKLIQDSGIWKIQSGYGTFPLNKELQSKPDVQCEGVDCAAVTLHGLVIEYHFQDDTM